MARAAATLAFPIHLTKCMQHKGRTHSYAACRMPPRGSSLQRSYLSLCSVQSGLTVQGGPGRSTLGYKMHRDPSLGSQHASCDDASMTDSGQRLSIADSCQREARRLSQDLMDGDPCSRAAAELLEGSESGGEADARTISPCRQAATELMESSCQQDSELGDAASQGVYGSIPQQRGDVGRTGVVPIPGLESQPDWLTMFLEQAQSVGLWGSGTERPLRAALPIGGRPILSDSLLERAVSGVRAPRPPPPRRSMPRCKQERDSFIDWPAVPGATRTQVAPYPLNPASHLPKLHEPCSASAKLI